MPGTVYHELEPVDLLFRGWSNNDPGFDSIDVPGGGVVPLSSSARIWLEVVRLDRAFYVVDNAQQVLEFPGDDAFLGDSSLHTHLTWLVDRDDPRFNPAQCVWEATFVLADSGSFLQDSQPFTFLFSNVPVRPEGVSADGDFDEDGGFGDPDRKALGVCVGGPGVRPDPRDPSVTRCEVECHNAFDMDDDLDVDLFDVAELSVALGG
jgi:hypothetical protein